MKYYKDDKNNVFAIGEANDGSHLGDQSSIVQSNWTRITEAEMNLILNPPKTDEEIAMEEIASNITKYTQYLKDTDHKFITGYVPSSDEDLDIILELRNEYREYIREHS
jgi:hypothetical protein